MRCKVVKFEVENFKYLHSNTIENYKFREKKIETGFHLSCNLHIIGANIYCNLAYTPFLCKKNGPGWVDGWVGGWMDGWMVEPV